MEKKINKRIEEPLPPMVWIKMPIYLLSDGRFKSISDEVGQLTYFELYLIAAECNANGALIDHGKPCTTKELSFRLSRIPGHEKETEKRITKGIKELIDIGFMHTGESGEFIITRFEEEQTSLVRRREQLKLAQKRYREKNKNKSIQ